MKLTILITMVSIFFANVINTLPGKTIKEYKDVEVKEHTTKIEQIQKPEVQLASYKPVYCADFLKQYDWNQSVAYNVMMVESKNNARNLNDNPATGDYSVGCFQVNLLGGNLQSKYNIAKRLGYSGPLERDALRDWLWNPANNVAVAWELYKGSGWQPWSFTTCKKVACY